MKKFIALIFVVGLVVGVSLLPTNFNFSSFNIKKATAVADLEVAKQSGEDFIINGNDAIISLNPDYIDDFYKKYDVKALIFVFDKDEFNELAKEMKLQKISNVVVEEMNVSYFYTPLFEKCFIADGRKINAEMVEIGEEVVIGFPNIMTGY